MKEIKWNNTTAKHPKGVCEAATVTWLQKIKQHDIATANKITPTDCDALQKKVEKSDFNWAESLASTVGTKSFDAFNGNTLKEDNKDQDDI